MTNTNRPPKSSGSSNPKNTRSSTKSKSTRPSTKSKARTKKKPPIKGGNYAFIDNENVNIGTQKQ